jgi:hypothetical protein
MYLPPTYPEQSADHEFPVEVVELVRVAAVPGEVRRTSIEAAWWEEAPIELAIGRPIRTKGRRGHRATYVAVDALIFETLRESVHSLILDLAPKLQERGYTIYSVLGELREFPPPKYKRTWVAPSQEERVILAVIQAEDPYEPLRIEGPGSTSVPIQGLIKALEEWKRFSSFEIVIAHHRVLELAFRVLPPKLTAFARSVYDLNLEAFREVLLVEPRDDWETIDYIRALDAQKPADLVRHLRKTKNLRLAWS